MHRSRVAALTVLTLLTGGVFAVGPAPAATAVPAVADPPCTAGAPLQTDFDGDGMPELVVGGRRDGADWTIRQQWVHPGDGGAAYWVLDTGELRTADLNGDVCADAVLFAGSYTPWLKVALGTPDGLDVAGATEVPIPQAEDAGEEQDVALEFEAAALRHHGLSQLVLSGRHSWEEGSEPYGGFIDFLTLDAGFGLAATQVLEFPGAEGPIRAFGSALATSGGTVAVGVPMATVSGRFAAGAVRIYTPDGVDPGKFVLRKVLTQNSAGVPGAAESNDRFGAALAMRDGRLAIGAPGEDDGRIGDAGLVQPLRWKEATATYTAYRAITQDTPGVAGSNEARDDFGARLAIARGLTATGSYDILIGASEDVGRKVDAGSVTVANFTRSLYRTYTQSSSGIPGNPQTRDDFFHVGVLQGTAGVDTVLIGAPGEDTGGVANLGRVVRSDGRKLTSRTAWSSVPVPPDAPSGIEQWGWDFAAG